MKTVFYFRHYNHNTVNGATDVSLLKPHVSYIGHWFREDYLFSITDTRVMWRFYVRDTYFYPLLHRMRCNNETNSA